MKHSSNAKVLNMAVNKQTIIKNSLDEVDNTVVENNISNNPITQKTHLQKAADFETAIDTAGFGLYNILLLLVALPAAMATVFETSTMSYIMPVAECDLKLTLLDKGVLNAITYAGMISSAVFWGYVADTKGRHKLLVFGYLADVVCVLGGALSQNVLQLIIFKYLGGFIMSGPFAVLLTYLMELHGKLHRARVMMMVGIMFSLASLILPVLALTILPQQRILPFIGLKLKSWQIFLATTAVPSLLSGFLLIFFPESPKFLMSRGRNQEALEIFKRIFALNKLRSKASYPIKELVNEVTEKEKQKQKEVFIKMDDKIPTFTLNVSRATTKSKSKISVGLRQIRPLFSKPYLPISLWVYLLNFCVLLSQNTIRLWLPQLFASTTEFIQLKNDTSLTNTTTTSLCTIIEFSVGRMAKFTKLADDGVSTIDTDCNVVITTESYTNNFIVGAAGLFGYIIAGFLVNLVGVKYILTLGLFIAGSCGIGLYWTASAWATVILASVFVTMGSISGTSIISASTNLFPTQLRTMIVSLEMMFGRLGSLLGNILFANLMTFGCLPPFLMVSFFMFSASLLALFLPLKNKTPLK